MKNATNPTLTLVTRRPIMMTSISHRLFVLAAIGALCLSVAAPAAHGAIVVSQAGAFPASPELTVVDETQDDSGVTLNSSRQLTQTFQVATGFAIDKFYIDAGTQVASKSFTVSIFTVADTNAGAPDAVPTGTNLLTTTIATTPSSLSGTSGVLEFDLTGSDEIFLAATTGTAGYALQLDRTEGDGAFVWLIHESGDGTSGGTVGPDLYTAGQAYGSVLGGGFTHGNSDYTLAFTAVPTPAALPAGLALIALAAMRRKMHRAN